MLKEAVDAYGKALEIKPACAPARYNMAVTLGDMGYYRAAIR
jgi:hypothetical protein